MLAVIDVPAFRRPGLRNRAVNKTELVPSKYIRCDVANSKTCSGNKEVLTADLQGSYR